MTTITTPNVRYLKHAGQEIDVKVTFKIVNGEPVLYIRDGEFFTFEHALTFLKHIVETEICSQVRL